MQYKYCDDGSFEDFASGRVIIHKPGFTNFPVRLAQEIFCRCLFYLKDKTKLCLYDPCCGSGYMLTVLGLLNYDIIETVVASDCDDGALETAERNLRLLTVPGMNERIRHLLGLHAQFNKASHLQAAESAERLKSLIIKGREINTLTFNADILSENILKYNNFRADIVFTDIPYGNLVPWQKEEGRHTNHLLENLLPILKPDSVVAVCANKQQAIHSDKFIRKEKQKIGKRKFEIFKLHEG
jgi:tRNA G10  N-methylase Trm11